MHVLRSGEPKRFELPFKVDRRAALILIGALVAGMAGHLIFQALRPNKAGAAQPHQSTLAMDSQPAIYLTPMSEGNPRQASRSAIAPEIDIQPHVAHQHRKRHREQPKPQAAEVKPPEPKEEETQSVERIDHEDGTTFIPKRSKDEDQSGDRSGNDFNGLGD